ncbi:MULTISPECIES: BPSL0761 family protein [Rhodanobacter]|uniref:BPSL0761 family protein n=1 Tax=Rhodanobacter TaxID=75309 RepID=UPI0009DBBFFD|nr:BPSL0761 family protein [Rhodanobacter sp. OR444]TAN18799.1 MAG: hypothetical protein EPN35_03145 [Rhodanobacter sp.]
MTLPYERSRAVIETRQFLKELLTNARVPASVRGEARNLLRHYPGGNEVFRAGWQELAEPRLVMEPIFGTSTDGSPSPNWPAPPARQAGK